MSAPTRLLYRVHAVQRMAERGIREEDVARVVAEGKEIESYPDDKPYPSRLLLGWIALPPDSCCDRDGGGCHNCYNRV